MISNDLRDWWIKTDLFSWKCHCDYDFSWYIFFYGCFLTFGSQMGSYSHVALQRVYISVISHQPAGRTHVCSPDVSTCCRVPCVWEAHAGCLLRHPNSTGGLHKKTTPSCGCLQHDWLPELFNKNVGQFKECYFCVNKFPHIDSVCQVSRHPNISMMREKHLSTNVKQILMNRN